MLGPACFATAMAMPMADGRSVRELLETLHPENRLLRALELFDHYCAMGAQLLARHEQIQRASDARSAATAAMATAAAKAALWLRRRRHYLSLKRTAAIRRRAAGFPAPGSGALAPS